MRKPVDAGCVARDFVEHVVPLDIDQAFLFLREQPVDQDRLGAELVAAMHHRHLLRDTREVQRFFHGRVAAADHRDFAVL